jgi:integrase
MSTASREPDYRDPACRSWRFTPARIDAACRAVADGEVPTDASGRVQWRDAETKGLFLRVTSNGHGTFTLFYKKAGKPIRKAIGIVGEITLGEAREAASALRYDRTLAAQVKPRERRGEQVEGPTVGEAFDGYIDAAEAGTFTMGRRKQPITDRTAQGYRDCYAATLKAHADRPLSWLAENVVRLHREMGAASGTGKDRKPARPYQGNRILHDEEEARLGTALLAEPLLWRDLFGLALLTGRRMSAVCRMRWGDVDLSRRLWVAPREEMKGRKAAHGVPLDSDAVALLKRRKAMAGESEWVFPAVRSPGPVASWKTAWGRIRDAAGLGGKDRSQRVRPHDLRRSWGSRLIEAGAPTVTVNQLMGNSPSSVGMTARVYMQIPDAVQIEAIDGAFRRRQARKAKARPTGEKKPRGRQKKSDAAP